MPKTCFKKWLCSCPGPRPLRCVAAFCSAWMNGRSETPGWQDLPPSAAGGTWCSPAAKTSKYKSSEKSKQGQNMRNISYYLKCLMACTAPITIYYYYMEFKHICFFNHMSSAHVPGVPLNKRHCLPPPKKKIHARIPEETIIRTPNQKQIVGKWTVIISQFHKFLFNFAEHHPLTPPVWF